MYMHTDLVYIFSYYYEDLFCTILYFNQHKKHEYCKTAYKCLHKYDQHQTKQMYNFVKSGTTAIKFVLFFYYTMTVFFNMLNNALGTST